MTATVWHVLAEPWREPIMRRAFAEMLLLGVAGGALGCWVILYELSYSAESLAHSLLPGLVLAALAGVPLLLGGAASILLAAALVAVAGRVPSIGRDTAVAVVVTTLFGLGVLLALSPQTPTALQGLLFGDVLGVSDADVALAGGLAVGLVVVLGGMHGRLLIVAFDRGAAGSLGVASGRVDAILLALIAVAILVAVQALGNLLVVAVLIAPAASAGGMSRRMAPMMTGAAGIAVASGIGGLYLSYYARIAAGASIAAVLIAVYATLGVTRALTRRQRRPAPGR